VTPKEVLPLTLLFQQNEEDYRRKLYNLKQIQRPSTTKFKPMKHRIEERLLQEGVQKKQRLA